MQNQERHKWFGTAAYTEMLEQLLSDVLEIRNRVAENSQVRLQAYKTHYRSGVFTKSAINLAHYLTLRQFDLRHLQTHVWLKLDCPHWGVLKQPLCLRWIQLFIY